MTFPNLWQVFSATTVQVHWAQSKLRQSAFPLVEAPETVAIVAGQGGLALVLMALLYVPIWKELIYLPAG